MLSDRYSCQEHNQNKELGCIACEVYTDILELEIKNIKMKKALDNIKVRSYELGQIELHNMAWKALI